MTELNERLNNLKAEIEAINNDNTLEEGIATANLDLDLIENYLGDLKNASKLSVAEQEELFTKIGQSVEELEKVIVILKRKLHDLKLKQIEQKKKIKKIAGLCVGGGLLAGLTLALSWKALSAFVKKYTTTVSS